MELSGIGIGKMESTPCLVWVMLKYGPVLRKTNYNSETIPPRDLSLKTWLSDLEYAAAPVGYVRPSPSSRCSRKLKFKCVWNTWELISIIWYYQHATTRVALLFLVIVSSIIYIYIYIYILQGYWNGKLWEADERIGIWVARV